MPQSPVPPDAVPVVPGYGKPRVPIYAGNLPVDAATRGVQLFYIFTSVLSSALSPHAPVVLWLQGGGGASPPWGNQTGPFALGGYAGGGPSSFGMLCEKIGPFSNPDNATGKWVLKDNPLTWNRFAHLLFIDQPAGVGLSSFSAAENGYAANGTMLGHDLATALVGFFARHPELSSNPLYIFGESYAGHYVPHVASYILEHAHESFYAALAARFAGVGLGDVCPGEEHTLSLPDLVHGLGYLSPEQLVQAHATGSRCQRDLHRGDYAAAFKSCEALEVFKGLASGGIHDQDSRTYANYSSLTRLVNVDGATQEGHWNALANAWLDEPAVRSALHAHTVGNRSVSDNQPNCTRGLWDDNDNARSTIGLLPRMLTELKVLFYNGNFDVSCNFLGTERLLASLGRWFAQPAVGEAYDAAFGAREQRWFTLSSKMAGYVRHVPLDKAHFGRGALTHVIVQGAGHLAPRDQPARVSAMVRAFLRGGDIEALDNCSLPEFVAAPPVLNLGGLAHEKYRPLFCPWLIKPFRDPFDMAVTEAGKWPVYRKLLGVANVSVGLPVAAFFGVCACRIYANATMALKALSAYDPCWYNTSELERCNAGGHHAPWEKTNLTKAQFDYLMRNASYADEATPHL